MTKEKSRLHKSNEVMNGKKETQWCSVDTENEFVFGGKTFVINQSVKEYKVYNKAGEVEDYTNEAVMERILVTVAEVDNSLQFFNENLVEVDGSFIRPKE